MPNKRIIFATQQVAIKGDQGGDAWHVMHGVQSFNKTTTFNLEQVFELGQLAIYENIEGVPTVEATMSKVLDGYPLIWHEASIHAAEPTLIARANSKCYIGLSIYPDTNSSASGLGMSEAEIGNAFVTSLSYTFGIDGNFTESVTFQASDIVWADDPRMTQDTPWVNADTINIAGGFATNDDSPIGDGGVNRRENFIWDFDILEGLDDNGQIADPDASTLPPEVDGISANGSNGKVGDVYNSSIQSVTVTCNLAREDIFQLGRRTQYFRTLTFPTEVSTEITVTGGAGDMVSATDRGIYAPAGPGTQCTSAGNLADRTIRIATCEGTRVYTGTKNKLASVAYSGGDAGGGNVTITYTYQTFNHLTVLHENDPNSNGATWWTNRADWVAEAEA